MLTVTSVRHAEPEDLPDLARLLGGRPRPGGVLLVVGWPPLGAARLVELGDGTMRLDPIVVLPQARQQGLGGMLLRAAYGVVLDRGLGRVTVTATASTVDWYAAHGFSPISGVTLERAVRDEPDPIPAVSVIPVREGRCGLEVFVQHRVATMDFAAGAVVFPGGRVDPGDPAAGAALDLCPATVEEHVAAWRHTAVEVLGAPEAAARTVLACGVREVAEETGAWIDPARLVPWDDWETPTGLPKRFDVRFLVFPVESDADAATFGHTTTEAVRSGWLPVADIARAAQHGSLLLMTPTRVIVDELARLGSRSAVVGLRPPVTRVRHDTCPSPARRGRLTRRPTDPR